LLIPLVRSGDPENVEARAARIYWPLIFADDSFRRDREGENPNPLLNYGYAVLRAIVARAICAAGLHPALGLHHHNQYNPFCLADDLMEPFRPVVDCVVAEVLRQGGTTDKLDSSSKGMILDSLLGVCQLNGESRTLFDAAASCAQSLAAVFMREAERL